MKVHEFQAKALLQRYHLPMQAGVVVEHVKEADAAYTQLGKDTVVAKAQVHAGGRGKAGGIRVAHSLSELQTVLQQLLGMKLITKQTGAQGTVVRKVLIEPAQDIAQELYVGITLDREHAQPCIIASPCGGVDIEEIAEREPTKIFRQRFDAEEGLSFTDAQQLAERVGIAAQLVELLSTTFRQLAQAFVELDAQLIEINPLIVTRRGQLSVLDAKMIFDDNALFRHPDITALRDIDEEDPREVEAARHGLSYVGLDGNIGCMVNGAGLAMATMDLIQLAGGRPANFLDVGGGASKEKVAAAFRILLADKQVRAVLVNIFGGILRCDTLAEGIIAAAKEVQVTVPMVVRLEGTNVERGRKLLAASQLSLITISSFAEAAKKVVELAQ